MCTRACACHSRYVYSAAFDAYETGVLPCHPLYYDWPEEEEAYTLSGLRGPGQPIQHSFGDNFVVSPITKSGPPSRVPPTTCMESTQVKSGVGVSGQVRFLIPEF
jgi:hypothetical protein